jgi:histidyl-tRNA synthetase
MSKSLKGMPDLLPAEIGQWHAMENRLRQILTLFAYEEIRTPFLEPSELFARSIGEGTDVVEKEMYTMTDKDGSLISLRPEGTASIVRAYLEHHLGHGSEVCRLYYMGPMFRHERPQKGRLRQFHQVGAEILGHPGPTVDADLLLLATYLMTAFEVSEWKLEINSVGDSKCRPSYRTTLQTFLRNAAKELCETCQKRTETNPMRVFDCKVEACRAVLAQAPVMFDYLCNECRNHFDRLESLLGATGIPYFVNKRIVRGLDYYSRTAFEIAAGGLGSQNTVLAGGRYDGLAAELDGKPVPAIGFAMGLERLLLSGSIKTETKGPRIQMIPLDGAAEPVVMKLGRDLRAAAQDKGAVIDTTPLQQSLKGALGRANKSNAQFAVLIGADELAKKSAQIKNLADHTQVEVPFTGVVSHLLEKL